MKGLTNTAPESPERFLEAEGDVGKEQAGLAATRVSAQLGLWGTATPTGCGAQSCSMRVYESFAAKPLLLISRRRSFHLKAWSIELLPSSRHGKSGRVRDDPPPRQEEKGHHQLEEVVFPIREAATEVS